MKVFVVEVQSGNTDDGDAFIFDSVWVSEQLAKDYARKVFSPDRWAMRQAPEYTIEPFELGSRKTLEKF